LVKAKLCGQIKPTGCLYCDDDLQIGPLDVSDFRKIRSVLLCGEIVPERFLEGADDPVLKD